MSKSFIVKTRKGDSYEFIVDDNKYEEVAQFKWHAIYSPNRKCVYARRWVAKKSVFLHWQIVGRPEHGMMIDHKNGNSLDNRAENLRRCSYQDNLRNRRSYSASGLKGAYFHPASKLWQAKINIDSRKINLGYYKTAKAAHEAYCACAKMHYGEFFNSGD